MISEAEAACGLPPLTEKEFKGLVWRDGSEHEGQYPIYAWFSGTGGRYILDGRNAYTIRGNLITSYDHEMVQDAISTSRNGFKFATAKPEGVPFRGVR